MRSTRCVLAEQNLVGIEAVLSAVKLFSLRNSRDAPY